jgi:DNA-binding transcriptional LysR family regulator
VQIEGEFSQLYTAIMQPKNWNDLRFLLAIKRGQTLKAAARRLNVDDTTVSRRLAALRFDMGVQLVQRRRDGRFVLTEVGEFVARQAEVMEQHFHSINTVVGDNGDTCVGTVRVTSVPILTNRLFASSARDLVENRPHLVIELIPDSRDLNLTHREADVAVRLARPTTGGMNVKARRIGVLAYATYASRTIPLRKAGRLPWITYEESMSHLPQARWISGVVKGKNGLSGLRVHDAETALDATVAGLGKTLLPTLVADRDARLRRLSLNNDRPYPSREIWLLAHADQVELARVKAVTEWVEKLVNAAGRK